jgi:cytochrome P450
MRSPHYASLAPDQRRGYLRDAAITIVLTGFDTTSSALFWTIYLLSKNSDAVQRLRAEGATNLDRCASENSEASQKCEYLDAVILEALRMYPPVWYVGREAVEDTTLRGYHIPAGAFVLASPYVVHRNPWIWESPSTFRPERFLANSESPFNAKGYLPFGMGPRFCIGRGLALYEIALVIAAICREFDPVCKQSGEPELLTAFTLRPKEDIRITFRRVG